MATWKSLDQYAPFAQILVRYMWEARPPLNPNQLAVRAGVRRQVLSQWLNAPATADLHPDPAAVVKVARAMGMPVADLLIAAGHATEADPLLDRKGAIAYVAQLIESSAPIPRQSGQDGSDQQEQWDEPTHQRVLMYLRALDEVDTEPPQTQNGSANSLAGGPDDSHG
jgi:transcriptional regulator with XRE-family HTH domain